eukprot:COSAG02_NODE_8980_length_2374_cov_1.366154_2_plen_116_part_00
MEAKQKALARGENKKTGWKEKRQKLNKAIKNSCREDYRAWAENIAAQMEQATESGDARAVKRLTKLLCGKSNSFNSDMPRRGFKMQDGEIEWGAGETTAADGDEHGSEANGGKEE